VQCNAAFISLLESNFHQDEIRIFAEENHINEVKQKIKNTQNLKFFAYKSYSSERSRFYWIQKIVGEWIQIFKVIKTARNEKPKLIIWLSLFPTGHLFLSLFSKLNILNTKQIIILHGELEYLKTTQNKRVDVFLGWILKKAISNLATSCNYFVLGKSIYKNLEKLPLKIQNNIRWLPHPFLYNEISIESKIHSPLKVVLFGALKVEKNGHLFFELAKKFENQIAEGLIQFNTLGRINKNLYPFINNCVNTFKPNEFISQKEMEENLAKHNLSLFFYELDKYKLTASGSVHEAINARLPFVAFKNDYFISLNNLFEMGKFVNNIDEMEAYILQLLKKESLEVENFRKSIIMFLHQNSFPLQSQNLKKELNEFGISC
jgi:hypothetical protein